MAPPKNRQRPLRTAPAFTPTSRTPWGGTRIAARYGQALGLEAGRQLGEAWMFSLDPAFPSQAGDRVLGAYVESTLLLKLLDAAEPLSVQIHPADDYAGLTPHESGKPEAWYVLERDLGAGLFLGFLPGVDEARVRRALAGGEDLSALMHFVPVEPGDFFVIDAGTPHAIGAGVMLVEPQRVLPGWSGVTYRYWDWNRRYDEAGLPSASGTPRALHVEHALAVTDWSRVTQPGFVDSIRSRTGSAVPTESARLRWLTHAPGSGRVGALEADAPQPVPSAELTVARLTGSGACALPQRSSTDATALCVLDGVVRVAGEQVARGETLALVASGQAVELEGAHALWMAARPA